MRQTDAQRRLQIALRQVDRELGLKAVCLVGTGKKVPREKEKPDPYDNDPIEWVEPIRVVVTDDPKDAPTPYNKGAHSYTYRTLAYVYAVDVYAAKLKKHLDEMLFGNSVKALMRGWKDCETWIAELLFGQAVQELGIEVYDEAGRQKLREERLRKKRMSWRVKL